MRYTKFEIKNFKGINDLTLDLSNLPSGKIFPLVGLNESGKTTILEAVNFFQEDVGGGHEYELIHKKDSGNFTGSIEVEATLALDDDDRKAITSLISGNSLLIESEIEEIQVTKRYSYENASFLEGRTLWQFTPELSVKTARQKKFARLYSYQKEQWDSVVAGTKKRIPKILYFPNFLFDFPDKIYLENIETLAVSEKDKSIQKEYKQMIDDILRCINPDYKLTDFLTKLKSSTDQGQQSAASQIKQEISAILNRKIVTPWQQIFSGPSKNILVETENDSIGYFLQIKVGEGTSPFLIKERSLGFRWFFGFILFTEFRKERDGEHGEYIFLFDEPASNLHERSQQKLLALFENLTSNAKIIYSTHSPYLINKKSILNAFVVKDEGRNDSENWNFKQDIKSIPYRRFVADNPNEETHFKPLLDVLEFVDNPFVPTGNIVFFEGKFDYYTFKLVEHKFFTSQNYNFNFYPGAGVDRYENIFREYLGNNRRFIAILDADGGGIGAKKLYIKDISQELEQNIFTLKDVDNSFDAFQTEKLFSDVERLEIQNKFFPASTTYKKSEFNTAIQGVFIGEDDFLLSDETLARFKKIFDFIKQKFAELK